MARRIDSRLKIACTLIARTPLHVGGMGGNVDTDLALAVNGEGEFYIPGTSLTGALRGWFETRAETEEAKKKFRRLLGYQKQKQEKQPDQPGRKGKDEHASFLLVENAEVAPPAEHQLLLAEIRDGVGIDRVTGAAANQIKFDRAILPRGTRISFEMCVELGGDEAAQNEARSLTHTVLRALQAGEIRFGAAKSRGLGRVDVTELAICEQGLLRKNGLLDTLRGKGKTIELGKSERQSLGFEERPRLTIDIAWKPRGPLMVKSEHDGFAVDMLPLTSAVADHLSFVLPGSSIKGAFREQAERIVRTLLNIKDVRIVESKQDFINQVEVKEPKQQKGPEHTSLIGWLFGTAGDPAKEDEKGKSRLPGFSAVTFDDCYAELAFSAEQWSAIERAKNEQELRGALEMAKLGNAQQAFHVAIDRWLGSAADGFLYSVLEPHGVSWETIRLSLDLARLPDEDSRERAVMLLLLTLRDFVAGRIPLGFGVNRGMGAVEVTGINVAAADCESSPWLKDLAGERLNAGKLDVPEGLRKQLKETWQTWIKKQIGEEGK
jgi:CRISPR/Cas system CSM-associated protein Csm3 (group 7 of RAMP superfamily)